MMCVCVCVCVFHDYMSREVFLSSGVSTIANFYV